MRRISKAGAERGYAVASVLLALVVIALGAQVATIPTQSALTRNAEAELIFRGQAYAAAIRSYRNAIEDDPRLPQNLEELLDDRRFIGRRHIRRLYDDPMTGGAWTVLRDEDGGIRGVASRATGAPRKKAFFPAGLSGFATATSYTGWRFVFDADGG